MLFAARPMPRPSTAPKVASDQGSKALRRRKHDAHAALKTRVAWDAEVVGGTATVASTGAGFFVEEFSPVADATKVLKLNVLDH
ncbi:hypothetical protein CXB51_023553 [Gossypium anomalum]|uniref:Uncharacterized protein n=1 Tax=Gossypium anomalum TaxID=47600 RepID=A0A8J5Y6J6_9ROSI|nr:hypothetical protein CXB51_023553 [Gossypium anomalum]